MTGNDVTVPVTSVEMMVTSSGLLDYFESIRKGTVETVVTSEGSGWSFNCDGTAHYLQGNDVTKREPNGRYKRVYKGKINGGHVTHKGVTSDIPCPAQYERWAKVRHVSKCRIPEGNREDSGRPGDAQRRDELLAVQDEGWKDANSTYIQ